MKVYNNRELTLKICLSAMCMALAFALPFVTGAIPEIGNALAPMHLPAFLFGIVAGPYFGGVLAFLAPILRSLMFGAPAPIFPRAITMSFELMAYAVVFGLLYKLLSKKLPYIYVSLVCAMIVGRLVGGVVKIVLLELGVIAKYNLALFISGYVTESIPGIVVQLLVIPPVVLALRRAKLID